MARKRSSMLETIVKRLATCCAGLATVIVRSLRSMSKTCCCAAETWEPGRVKTRR
ncbi:MAG: hypothetical protein ACYTGP_13350 [Planctomycetota bacterium]